MTESARRVMQFRIRTYDGNGVKQGEFCHESLDYILHLRENSAEWLTYLDIIWRDVVIFTESRRPRGCNEPDSKVRYWPEATGEEVDKMIGG